MASLVVLAAGGTASVGPGIALFAGLFDAFALPRLLGGTSPDPPSIGSYYGGAADEGEPIYWCLGAENRVPGFIRWRSDVRVVGGDTGGKGGGGQGSTPERFADMAVAFCDAADTSAGVANIDKIWASGRLIYDGTLGDVVISTDAMAVTFRRQPPYGTTAGDGEYIGTVVMALDPTAGAAFDWEGIPSGATITVAGFAQSRANGTFQVAGFSGNPTYTLNVLLNTQDYPGQFTTADLDAGNYDEAAGASVTITWNQGIVDSVADSITIYKGTEAQTADSILQTAIGAADTPAWRGSVYAVIENLNLTRVGIAPQFNAQIQEAASRTVAEAVQLVLGRAKDAEGNAVFPSTRYDTSGIAAANVRGYFVRGPQSLVDQLRPLMFAYDLLVTERGGKLYFLSRANADTVTAASADLAAHTFGEDAPRDVELEDGSDEDVPTEVVVNYRDAALDYQRGSQRYRGTGGFNTDNVVEVNLGGMSFTADEAQQIARRIYWQAHAGRVRGSVQLPPSYHHITEGDRLTVTDHGETFDILAHQVDKGGNGLILVSGQVERDGPLTVDFNPTGSPGGDDGGTGVTPAPAMLLHVLDTAPLDDADILSPTLYLLTCAYTYTATFSGATLYESTNGSTFNELQGVGTEATLGVMVGTPAGGVTGAVWDEVNTFTVDLYHGTLASATDSEVLNGSNLALVGDEYIAFGTATLTGTNDDGTKRYTISHLLRGLRDTDDAIDSHGSAESFTLITVNQTNSRSLNLSAIDATRYYKSAATGATLSSVPAVPVVVAGNTLRPFAPCDVQGSRDSSGNLTLSWIRRTRALVGTFDGEPPLVDSAEEYEVDVMNGATVVRTLDVSGQTSATYTAAQQTTDFGATQSSLTVRVYQVNAAFGRGKKEEVTV